MAHAPPKTKTPTGVQPAGAIRDNESHAASENVNSTFGCFDAIPLQKRPLAAVRGKLGVQVRTVGILQKTHDLFVTRPRSPESLAHNLSTEIFFVEVMRD